MKEKKESYPGHSCQYCGSERKLVETLIDDEFVWDKHYGFIPNKFTDCFEHTGNERCARCEESWTGA